MDIGTILELLAIAFGGGAAWGTLRSRLKTVERTLSKISKNDLPHIQEALESLPCREPETCPDP